MSGLELLVKMADAVPHAVLDTDTHFANLYVEADGTPGFFDLVSQREPVMIEIAYYIGCVIDPLDRRRWERAGPTLYR